MTVNNENGLRTYKSHSEEIAAEIFQSLRHVLKIVFLSADIILFCVEKKQNITYSREESSLLNWRYIKASFFIFKIHLLIQSCMFSDNCPFIHPSIHYSSIFSFKFSLFPNSSMHPLIYPSGPVVQSWVKVP